MSELILAIPMFVCAFLSTIILSSWSKRNHSQRRLIGFFIAVFVLFLCKTLIAAHPTIVRDIIHTASILAICPMIYFYIRTLTFDSAAVKSLQMFMPTIVSVIALIVFAATIPDGDIALVKRNIFEGASAMPLSFAGKAYIYTRFAAMLLYMLQLIQTLWYSAKHIRQFDDRLKEYYSNIVRRKTEPILKGLILSIACAIVFTVWDALTATILSLSDYAIIPSLLFAVILLWFGQVSLMHVFSREEFGTDMNLCAVGVVSPNEQHRVRILHEFNQMMSVKRIYTDSDLKLTDLAQTLGVDCSWLTDYIRKTYGCNFYDYVNRLRADYVEELLNAPSGKSDTTVLEEAFGKSGFPSRRVYRQAFKKYKGSSVEDWCRQRSLKRDFSV